MRSNETFGHITILTATDHEGIFISVFNGPHRVSELCRNFLHANRESAVAHYKLLRTLGNNWLPYWMIVDQMALLETAAQALIPDTIEEIN